MPYGSSLVGVATFSMLAVFSRFLLWPLNSSLYIYTITINNHYDKVR